MLAMNFAFPCVFAYQLQLGREVLRYEQCGHRAVRGKGRNRERFHTKTAALVRMDYVEVERPQAH